jgi:hypothetical protein
MDLSRPEARHAPTAVDIEVHELVLIGFPPIDRYAVAEALQRELGEALGSLAGTRPWAEGVTVLAGSIEFAREGSAGALGTSVAHAVARGLLR